MREAGVRVGEGESNGGEGAGQEEGQEKGQVVRFGQNGVQYNQFGMHSKECEIWEGRWTESEHAKFLEGVMLHGKDWKLVEKVVGSRTGSQVRSHAQKFFIKLLKVGKERRKCKNRELVAPSPIEKQILDNFTPAAITLNTPPEIAALLLKDWEAVAFSFAQKGRLPKPSKTPISPQQQGDAEGQEMGSEESKDMVDLYEAALGVETLYPEEESFLIKVIKMNKQHFKKGSDFMQLIDFGRSNYEEGEVRAPVRKSSFQLPHKQQDSVKLRETLRSLHEGLKGPQ